MSSRIDSVDVLRGIAILLVVAGHAIQYSGISKDNVIFEMIYSFHMPLFFFISGYVTGLFTDINNYNQLYQFINKKVKVLIIPWIMWTLLFDFILFKDNAPNLSIDYFGEILLYPKYWFFRYLFFVMLIFGVVSYIENIINKKNILKCLVALFAIIVYLYYGIDFFLFVAVFLWAVSISKIRLISSKKRDILFVVSILFFTGFVCRWDYYANTICNNITKVVISASACYMLKILCEKKFIPSLLSNRLSLYGKKTLSIYVIHYIFLRNGIGLQLISEKPALLFLFSIFTGVILCELCLILTSIIGTSDILSKVLLGEYKK